MKPLYIEWRGDHPFEIHAEDSNGDKSCYCVEYADDCFYFQNEGGGGDVIRLSKSPRREKIWAAPGVELRVPRMLSRWWAYKIPIKLAYWLGIKCDSEIARHWRSWTDRWAHCKAGRFGLWRAGYRLVNSPGTAMEDVFEQGIEGDTIWCSACARRYPTENYGGYMARRAVPDFDPIEGLAKMMAAEAIEEILRPGADAFCRRHKWRLIDEATEIAGSRLSDAEAQGLAEVVRKSLQGLCDTLADESNCEDYEHLCSHVWWQNGVGWTGPGVDE